MHFFYRFAIIKVVFNVNYRLRLRSLVLKMKKFSFVLLLIAVMIVATFNVGATRVLAKEPNVMTTDVIERKLEEKNADVAFELEKQIRNYQNRLDTETDEQKQEQLRRLILDTQKLLDDYKGSNKRKTAVATTASSDQNADPTYIPKELDVFFYENTVSAVVAFFYANEYYLSAELLTHARYNRELNSLYTPINLEYLQTASEFKSVCEKTDVVGTGRFAKSGGAKEMDLFYALHNFHYAKFQNGEVVTLYDVYDFTFDGGFDFIDDVPIKVMYLAQERGVIVPFNVVIETRLSGDGENRENEAYPKIAYTNGEYHLYKSACSNDCYANHADAHRDIESHSDSNDDGLCDGCGAVIGKLKLDLEEETVLDRIVSDVNDSIVGTCDVVKGGLFALLNAKGIGCSSSVGGTVGVGAIVVVGALLLKKKEH